MIWRLVRHAASNATIGAPLPAQELGKHQEPLHTFNRLALFAAFHVALVLAYLAMAFLGHVPWLGVLLGLGGTLALMVAFAISS